MLMEWSARKQAALCERYGEGRNVERVEGVERRGCFGTGSCSFEIQKFANLKWPWVQKLLQIINF